MLPELVGLLQHPLLTLERVSVCKRYDRGSPIVDGVAEQRRIASACSSVIVIVTNAAQSLQKILSVLSLI